MPLRRQPRHAMGCGNEPSQCLNFCHARRVFERSRERASSAAACSLRLPSLLHLPPQPLRVLLMCLYKRGRSSPEPHLSSHVREKGDEVFGVARIHDLLDDMAGEDTDPKSSASAATVPYVLFSFLLEVLLQFLVLVFALHMLDSILYMQLAILAALDVFSYSPYMKMLFTFSLSNRMAYFVTVILVMLYLIFLLIKSFGKLLIFPTSLCTEINFVQEVPYRSTHLL